MGMIAGARRKRGEVATAASPRGLKRVAASACSRKCCALAGGCRRSVARAASNTAPTWLMKTPGVGSIREGKWVNGRTDRGTNVSLSRNGRGRRSEDRWLKLRKKTRVSQSVGVSWREEERRCQNEVQETRTTARPGTTIWIRNQDQDWRGWAVQTGGSRLGLPIAGRGVKVQRCPGDGAVPPPQLTFASLAAP